jgi:hypothetical protein
MNVSSIAPNGATHLSGLYQVPPTARSRRSIHPGTPARWLLADTAGRGVTRRCMHGACEGSPDSNDERSALRSLPSSAVQKNRLRDSPGRSMTSSPLRRCRTPTTSMTRKVRRSRSSERKRARFRARPSVMLQHSDERLRTSTKQSSVLANSVTARSGPNGSSLSRRPVVVLNALVDGVSRNAGLRSVDVEALVALARDGGNQFEVFGDVKHSKFCEFGRGRNQDVGNRWRVALAGRERCRQSPTRRTLVGRHRSDGRNVRRSRTSALQPSRHHHVAPANTERRMPAFARRLSQHARLDRRRILSSNASSVAVGWTPPALKSFVGVCMVNARSHRSRTTSDPRCARCRAGSDRGTSCVTRPAVR